VAAKLYLPNGTFTFASRRAYRLAYRSQREAPHVIGRNRLFLLTMAAGSIVGTFIGGQLLGLIPSGFLLPLLACVLLISAVKVWRHS
jgi:uncharacterized protein